MTFDPAGKDYPLYNTALAEARRREKQMMFVNCSKLGALLITYVVMQRLLVYVYYVVAASFHSGTLIPLPSKALDYLRENKEFTDSTFFSMAGNLFVVVLSVIILLILARLVLKVDIKDMMRPRLKHIPQGLMWMPLCLLINLVISYLITILQSYLSAVGVTIPESDFTISTPDTASIVMQFIYVIVLGPLAEELIYRGLILTLLKPFGKWLAVFFSALIFGMMHGNIPQMASSFASALVMGVVAVQCGSIIPTLVIHICNNILASYMDFSDALGWSNGLEVFSALRIIVYIAGGFVIFVCSYRLLIKEERYALTTGQRFGQVFLNIPMLAYLGYLLYKIVSGIIKAN